MFAMKLNLVILLICLHVSICSRRIQNGVRLAAGTVKPYVVYIVRAPIASSKYDYWMCGGALVTSVFVVTSAACIDDVNYLYVIAGYAVYVNDSNIDKDPCTSAKKKKVIFTCCPAGYDVKYDQLEKWSFIDIGVVKVESPYDFNDNSFKTLCSYIPTTIPINYESKYQEPGTDALVFGWGHLYEWRKESDKTNYNQRELHYAPVLLMDKNICKKHYEVYNNMSEVIENYMICSNGTGNINDQGAEIIRTTPEPVLLLNCRGEDSCDEDDISYEDIMYNSRKNIKKSNNTYNDTSTEFVNKTTVSGEHVVTKTFENSRRNGICQNDHGGPIVTYIGTHEVLIGVASVFKVGEDSTCIGPFLYTSTHCNGAFLNCVLTYKDWPNEKNRTSRRSMCKKKPSDAGHATIHRHISWADHPAGPSDDDNHRNDAYSNLPVKHKPVAPQTFNEHHAKKSYAREKNIARPNPVYEQYEATSKYESNRNNNAHGNYAVNVMDASYGNNAGNGMNTAYGNHAAHSNHAANVMNAAHSNHAANVMGSAYFGNHGANIMNRPGEKYSQLRFAVNERHIATERIPQTVKIDNDRLIMRPQRPLHS